MVVNPLGANTFLALTAIQTSQLLSQEISRMLKYTGFLMSLASILLVDGCARLPETAIRAESPHSALPTQTQITSPRSESRSTPTSTSGPATLELVQPFWIGRGKIIAAVFLPDARQVAIAWGSSVSLHTVESGRELWYQPMLANLIAFDIHPQAERFAAALSDGSVMIFEASNGEARHFECAGSLHG
jgi:hypothetical protein